jgi:regulator of sirC expression with transglutaminase-like and TPR domain
MKKDIREIKICLKGEFEERGEKRVFHGAELKEEENRELFEFVRRLLKKTYYADYAVTRIYKTVEQGYIIKLFKQTENEYGGYVGTIESYVSIDDIKRAWKD